MSKKIILAILALSILAPVAANAQHHRHCHYNKHHRRICR